MRAGYRAPRRRRERGDTLACSGGTVTTRRRTAGSAGALLAALAAMTMLVTACGGNGRLSAHEYVRQAGAICRHAIRHADAGSGLTPRAALQTRTATQLEGLRPPEAMADFDAVWVALVRQSAAELDALVVSRGTGDRKVISEQQEEVATLTARAAELARAQGITACARRFAAAEFTSVKPRT